MTIPYQNTKCDIEDLTNQICPILKKNGVLSASLFGSVVKSQATPDSDIDLLVEYREGTTLLDTVGLQYELEKALGRKVDLVSKKFLHHRISDNVLKEQIRIL